MKIEELKVIAAKMAGRKIQASKSSRGRKMTPAKVAVDVSDDATYWAVIGQLGAQRR